MGKSFELLGLMTFNVFLALVLSATFLSGSDPLTIKTLTESHVENFLHEMSDISSGEGDITDYDITRYFMNHIAENGNFISTLSYSMGNGNEQEKELAMNKNEFISHVVEGLKSMQNRETLVQVEHIEINAAGKAAKVVMTNYERGVMPMDNGFGEVAMVPVQGTSYCEQELVLTDSVIQLQSAQCSTQMSFSDSY